MATKPDNNRFFGRLSDYQHYLEVLGMWDNVMFAYEEDPLNPRMQESIQEAQKLLHEAEMPEGFMEWFKQADIRCVYSRWP